MADQRLMRLSSIRQALPAIENYEWHQNAVLELSKIVPAEGELDITLRGKSILNGPFGEPSELNACNELSAAVKTMCIRYLELCLARIAVELNAEGVDPQA